MSRQTASTKSGLAPPRFEGGRCVEKSIYTRYGEKGDFPTNKHTAAEDSTNKLPIYLG